MTRSMKTLMLTAAISGLLGGASAATTPSSAAPNSQKTFGAEKTKIAGLSFADKGKHDCAGKNDCKGQGGCKTGDNGCKGKNSCKGKGGCATKLQAHLV